MPDVGFRVRTHIDRPPEEIITALAPFGTSPIADAMGRFQAMHPEIRPFNRAGVNMAGYALTVKVRPTDNLMIHKAIDVAPPGSVIVVDGGGDLRHSLIGEVIVRFAMHRGVKGFVIDGAIRDVLAIAELGLPVFAKGATPSGPYKDGPGELNFPVACGGVTVHPGDIVIGDDDGVVVVPPAAAADVLQRVKQSVAAEKALLQDLEAGRLDRSWVDESLRAKGCRFE